MKANKNKLVVRGVIFALILLGVVSMVYYLNTITIDNPDTNLAARNIETPYKLWLNGYLGLFFGFSYLGNINWLILPLSLIYYFKKRDSLKREHWAMVIFFALAFILISVKGFFNPRYAFTLLGLIILVIIILLNSLSRPLGKLAFKVSVGILFLFIGYNFLNETGTIRFQEKIGELFFSKTIEEEKSVEAEIEIKDEKIVTNLLEEIQKGHYGNTFLVNNLPDFYYQTNKKGLYYWSGNDDFYSPNGIQKLFERLDKPGLKAFLNKRDCSYIYTRLEYHGYNIVFDEFLEQECDLILSDTDNRQLYRIKNE